MEKRYDIIEKPEHYNRDKAIECIEEMIAVFGKKAVANFCLCNVWKYRYRANAKNGKNDLEKSDWYMKKYMELKEEKFPTSTTITGTLLPNEPIYINTLDKNY